MFRKHARRHAIQFAGGLVKVAGGVDLDLVDDVGETITRLDEILAGRQFQIGGRTFHKPTFATMDGRARLQLIYSRPTMSSHPLLPDFPLGRCGYRFATTAAAFVHRDYFAFVIE